MIAARRAALLALLVAALTPAALAGQQQSSDSLVHRIVVLENTVAGLEQRVRELEALRKGEPSRPQPVAASTKWRDIANWRQLRWEKPGKSPGKAPRRRMILSVTGCDLGRWAPYGFGPPSRHQGSGLKG